MSKQKEVEIISSESTALVPKENSAEALIERAIDKGVAVETMERLLAMRRELKSERAKELFNHAMADFQSECPVIQKTKKVFNKDKTLRYAYAPIDSIVEQVKPFLQKHGFSYTIDAPAEESAVTAICKVTHEFGHSETSSFKVPIDKDGYMTQPQKFASALTFAKRYAFCNAFGILTGDEDDDSDTTKPTPTSEKFAVAHTMIAKMQNIEHLKTAKEKFITSKNYTEAQKSQLVDLVDQRIEVLKTK